MSVAHPYSRAGDARALPARLKHRVTIQEPIYTVDDAGGSVVSWSDVATVWAEIRTRSSGGEKLFAGKLQGEHSHVVTIRYREGVQTSMRLSYDSRLFNIRRVSNVDEANCVLELLVEEGVAQ